MSRTAPTAEMIKEINSLHSANAEGEALKRTQLPYLVTSGSEFFGGTTEEEQIRNNSMHRVVYYDSDSGSTEFDYEPNGKVPNPRFMEEIRDGVENPDRDWAAGEWLVGVTLRAGEKGEARIPLGQRDLMHVFRAMCSKQLKEIAHYRRNQADQNQD